MVRMTWYGAAGSWDGVNVFTTRTPAEAASSVATTLSPCRSTCQ